MKASLQLFVLILSLGIVFLCDGCKKKAPEVTIDDAVRELQQSAPAKTATQPTGQQGAGVQAQSAPVQQMNEAVAEYKNGNYEEAVARLQKLRSEPVTSPQQAMAIQDATAAVMNDLYALAAKGDPRAQQAIQRYQQLQQR